MNLSLSEYAMIFYSTTWSTISAFASLPFKKKGIASHLCFYFLFLLIETTVIYSQHFGLVGYFTATLIEMLGMFSMIGLFTRGIIWKNFAIVFTSTQVANIGVTILTVTIPAFQNLGQMMVAKDDNIDFMAYIGLVCLSCIIIFFVSRGVAKILKPEILLNAKLYKNIAIIMMTATIIFGSYTHKVFYQLSIRQGGGSISLYVFFAIFLAIWLGTLNLVGYLYNRSEKNRIEKRRKFIDKLTNDTFLHYESLAQTNDELQTMYAEVGRLKTEETKEKIYAEYIDKQKVQIRDVYEFSLSGCLAVDSILYEYCEKAKNIGVRFSVVMEPFDNLPMSEQDVATIIETLMEKTLVYFSNNKKKYIDDNLDNNSSWVTFDVRMKAGMMIILFDMQGITSKRKKLRNLELLHDIVNKYSGVIEDKVDATQEHVHIFVPEQENACA